MLLFFYSNIKKTIKTKFDNIGPFARMWEKKEKIIPGYRGKIRDETINANSNIDKEVITIEGNSGTSILIVVVVAIVAFPVFFVVIFVKVVTDVDAKALE